MLDRAGIQHPDVTPDGSLIGNAYAYNETRHGDPVMLGYVRGR
jgi:hypothetical protein